MIVTFEEKLIQLQIIGKSDGFLYRGNKFCSSWFNLSLSIWRTVVH